jgi:hypothetical protein
MALGANFRVGLMATVLGTVSLAGPISQSAVGTQNPSAPAAPPCAPVAHGNTLRRAWNFFEEDRRFLR